MFLFFGLFVVFCFSDIQLLQNVMKQHDVLQLNSMLYILNLLFSIFVFYVFYFELFCNGTVFVCLAYLCYCDVSCHQQM